MLLSNLPKARRRSRIACLTAEQGFINALVQQILESLSNPFHQRNLTKLPYCIYRLYVKNLEATKQGGLVTTFYPPSLLLDTLNPKPSECFEKQRDSLKLESATCAGVNLFWLMIFQSSCNSIGICRRSD
jgi:hypothetical protein